MIVGVDYSSYEATVVAMYLDRSIGCARSAVASFRPASHSGEDAAIAALAQVRPAMAGALAFVGVSSADDIAESVIWIERGFGMSRRADFILGAYFAAIYAACHDFGLIVNPMEAREWKRTVTAVSGIGRTAKGAGNPNAKKEIANEACRAILELAEVDGSDWTPDALDAFGVAYTARKLNREALEAAR